MPSLPKFKFLLTLGLWLCFALSSALGLGARAFAEASNLNRFTDYDEYFEANLLWPESQPPPTGFESNRDYQTALILEDPLQTAEHRYLAASQFINKISEYGLGPRARQLCEQYPPYPDHMDYAATCVWASELSLDDKITKIEALAEHAAQRYPDRVVAPWILATIGGQLSLSGHLHLSIRFYKRAFELIPPQYEVMISEVKASLAGLYMNPLLNRKLHEQSVLYFQELISWSQTQEQSEYSINLRRHFHYNKGIAHLFLFQDYPQAIKELKLSLGNPLYDPESWVFIAYAQAKSTQKTEAFAALSQIDWQQPLAVERRAFLQCYEAIVRRIFDNKQSIESCLTLHEPQADVLLDLTRTLVTLSLPQIEENKVWRMFYTYYRETLEPDIQNGLAAAVTEVELQHEKAKNRFHTLKIENLKLYQDLSRAWMGAAVLMFLALALALWAIYLSRKNSQLILSEKEHVASILESIEEAILQIKADGKIYPEESAHLRSLFGQESLDQVPLVQLLHLLQFDEATQILIQEVLQAAMGEEVLVFELNSSHLPTRANLQDGKTLSVYWQPHLKEEKVLSFFLVLRDISASLAEEEERRRSAQAAELTLIYAKEILSSNARQGRELLLQVSAFCHALKERPSDAELTKRLAHQLHTIKGNARTLSWQHLQLAAHQWESHWLGEDQAWQLAQREFMTVAKRYQEAMAHFTESQSQGQIPSLLAILAPIHDNLKQLATQAGLKLEEFRFQEAATLESNERQAVETMLLHGLTNALDHGYVLPYQQGRAIQALHFSITFSKDHGRKQLLIEDHGVGLNLKAIQEKAKALGLTLTSGDDISKILTTDGLSTAAGLSTTSGRGIGLAAVRAAAESLGGQLRIENRSVGTGCALHISWPIALQQSA